VVETSGFENRHVERHREFESLPLRNMKTGTCITGNQAKADYLAKYLGHPVEHVKLELDEIQSLDLKEIVEHKVRQAYEKIKEPVLVEDVGLYCEALGGLPGPFIKFFVEEMPENDFCALFDGKSRKATARCVFGYYDGSKMELFEGEMDGSIAQKPGGENGYGWDRIFVCEGFDVPRAAMDEESHAKTYQIIKPFAAVKEFLETL
jgi:non-canonical purine NTP pyrophosphatase (RdgB/HAM1 family)